MSSESPEIPAIPYTNLVTQYTTPELPFTYPPAMHEGRPIEAWVSELRERGDANEEVVQRALNQAELVRYNKIAASSKDPDEHAEAATAFTRLSIALHGQPDAPTVHSMMRSYKAQVEDFATKPGVDRSSLAVLRDFYAELPIESAGALPDNTIQSGQEALLAEIKDYHQSRYADILELRTIDERVIDENTPVTAETFREVLERSIGKLALQNGAWNAWRAIIVDGNSCGMYAGTTTIQVGRDLPPAPLHIAQDLLVHELLVHAVSHMNAQSRSETLALGLAGTPSWIEAQEGIACSTGALPERVARRYGAIGLALGQVGRPRSYTELRPVELAWQRVSTQAGGKEVSDVEQQTEVDRILRRVHKGRGDDLEFSHVQPVYTKDHAYYTGYSQILDYMAALRNEGQTIEDIFTYLTSGLFHPYNEEHRRVMEAVTGRNLWPKSYGGTGGTQRE